MKSRDYGGVALVAPVTVPYVRFSEHGPVRYFGQALAQLLSSAGLAKEQVDGLAVSSFTLSPDGPQSLLNHFDLSVRWLESVPYGGASGIVAAQRAARAVQCGDAQYVACIAADTNQRNSFTDLVSQFSRFSSSAVYPYGAAGPNGVFALMTDFYMQRYGLAREHFGKLCVAQRQNAMPNENALLRKPLDLDSYLSARPVAEPLHLFDCVMPCAGAEAFLVTTPENAAALGLPWVKILGLVEHHNAYFEDPVQWRGGWDLGRENLYEQAGVGPEEIDFVETYDDYPVVTLMQLEDLGFLPKGSGAAFLDSTDLTVLGGGLPVNTCGGQLSCGQAGAAGGFLGLVEALRQLTGQTLGEQVPNVRTGVVSGYGMVDYDRCLCSAAMVAAAGADP